MFKKFEITVLQHQVVFMSLLAFSFFFFHYFFPLKSCCRFKSKTKSSPVPRPDGRKTIRRCWLPCCARALVEDHAAVLGAAEQEPKSPRVSPASLSPAPGHQAPLGFPRAARRARTARIPPRRTLTTFCSSSATCANLLMCFCNSRKFSAPKVILWRV